MSSHQLSILSDTSKPLLEGYSQRSFSDPEDPSPLPTCSGEVFNSPISKLPLELFTEIVKTSVRMFHATPFTFSQVCKAWRKAINNSPYGWHVLVLTNRQPLKKTKLWLENSQNKLWELTVRDSALDSLSESQRWQEYLKQHLDWTYLRVLGAERWRPALYFHNQKKWESLKNLETLNIGYNNPLSAYMELFGSDNNLRRLTLTLVGHKRRVEDVGLISNLTSLTLNNACIHGNDLATFFDNNPRLEHLSLRSVSAKARERPAGCLHLSCLKSLQIIDDFPWWNFNGVKLPALESLRLEQWNPRLLHSFTMKLAAGHHAPLTEISLRSCRDFSLCSLPALLYRSPNLQQLEIVEMCSSASWAYCNLTYVVNALSGTLYAPSLAVRSDGRRHIRQFHLGTRPRFVKLTHVDFSGCSCQRTRPRRFMRSLPWADRKAIRERALRCLQ